MIPSPIDSASIVQTLRLVCDPELDCNIVDLGLIYAIQLDGGKARVSMTFTAPGCPMHESICHGVRVSLLGVEGINEVDVEVVWDPPWSPTMMTAAGREQTGVRL